MKKEIIPAIIVKNQKDLEVALAKATFAKRIQIDIMDNKFVKNSSFQFNFKLKTKAKVEAHLMVQHPLQWIKSHADKVDVILFQHESLDDNEKVIQAIKKAKKTPGIVINPETAIEEIGPFLDKVKEVLVMTVHPGFYGSKFVPETLKKVKQLRALKPNLHIEVDGGITDKTIAKANKAGANLFVSGSFIMKNPQPQKAAQVLKKLIQQVPLSQNQTD
ncbi:MAG: ribulose-phosphate 3-epimerase [Nanoarchaeota archaeon]|nr:ribulose-phosphate 3-epimerase [Nanoarchaeota archaeon]